MRAAPPVESSSPFPISMRLGERRRVLGSDDGGSARAAGPRGGGGTKSRRFPNDMVWPLQERQGQLAVLAGNGRPGWPYLICAGERVARRLRFRRNGTCSNAVKVTNWLKAGWCVHDARGVLRT